MIKSYSPQLQSYLNDSYYMHFVYNGGDIPVTRKDPEGNIKKVDFKKISRRYPFKGSCVLAINDVAFHFYDTLKTYGYLHFKVKNLFLTQYGRGVFPPGWRFFADNFGSNKRTQSKLSVFS